jgi:hypothetical protein
MEVSPTPQLNQNLVSASALDFLLIEIVPLAQNVVQEMISQTDSQEDVYYRIAGYGHQVGLGLSELFTRDRPRFIDQLDVMKFICKELWMILYKKQIDNLKTNHRGIYVLIDNNFKYCQRMSTAYGDPETLRRATPYLWFPAGVIRGVLSGLGIDANVTFDAVQLPGVSFNIQMV